MMGVQEVAAGESAALHEEGGGTVAGVQVRVDAQSVHDGHHVAEGDEEGVRQIRLEGRGAAVARVVEDLGDVGVVGRGGGDLRVGHEALVVAGDSGPVREEGVEVDGT